MDEYTLKTTTEPLTTTKRQYWVDYLRIFSSFLVVLIHVSAIGWYNTVLTKNWISSTIFSSLAHCAVPLFFMISGMFLLDTKKELPIKKLLLHNFFKIYSIYVISMLGYGAWMLLQIHTLQSLPLDSLNSILYILFQGNSYLWFLPALCGIYLLLPLLRIITGSGEKGKKAIEYYLIIFMLIRLSVYTISALNLSTFLDIQLNTYLSFVPFNNYLAYFFLGYYLNTYGLSKKLTYLVKGLFIPSVLFLTGIPILQLYLNRPVNQNIFDSFSIFTYITTINLFLFFKSRKKRTLSTRAEKVLITCSNCTLSIYVLHAFVIDVLTKLGISIWLGPFYISIPLITLFVFLITLLLSYLLHLLRILFLALFHLFKKTN